ncbi:hypothetical protein WN51_09636 [Melipona quadrifasciata]|uniref:Uncharacterized protein n=1 Tax=Melipona quadrifasciata TaxID=166423 RepID=A0A0N0BIE2_9HYME|nr:hypothetical protein WN51_09636 [Melipona quadrifasciata]
MAKKWSSFPNQKSCFFSETNRTGVQVVQFFLLCFLQNATNFFRKMPKHFAVHDKMMRQVAAVFYDMSLLKISSSLFWTCVRAKCGSFVSFD